MRFWPRRRPPLPAGAAELLELPRGERVLAWSALVGGGLLVATPTMLRAVTRSGALIARPWHEVDHAAWEQNSRMLAVWWVGSRQATPLEIEDDIGRLPEVIRERVQASVVLATQVALPGGRTGRVALRSTPDGSVVVQRLVPPGVRADSPDVAALLDRTEAGLRADAGLDQRTG